ncbi:MAG: type II toxin-antitoxin system CcdA family antitoxin [Mycobacteriales bacterium]
MARVNITLPDDLHRRAREAGLNVSRLAQAAIASELDRQDKLRQLDAYLSELELEVGPPTEADRLAATQWVDRVLDARAGEQSA